jgi:hypothetical protein
MDIDRIKQHLASGVTIAVGVLLALFVGSQAGAGKFGLVAYVLLGMIWAFVALAMQERCGLLIPLFWMMTGQLSQMPVAVTLRELVVILVAVTFAVFIALKIVRGRPKMEAVDFTLLVCLLWLGFAFARNPAGLEIFGSDRIGGRPYFGIFVATLAFWVLVRSSGSPRAIRFLPWAMAALVFIFGFISLACEAIPQFAGLIGPFYSDFNAIDRQATAINSLDPTYQDQTRYWMLEMPGRFLAILLCSAYRPLSLLNPFRLIRFLLFQVALWAIAFSGFRSGIIYAGFAFIIGSYLQRGRVEAIRICVVALPLLAILVLGQGRLYDLPIPVQRTLSFLPGNWDLETKQLADTSTDWRRQIWHEVVTTDRYIENKFLGDGFGLTRQQHERIKAINAQSVVSVEQTQENAKLTGAFHSGPLNTIRTFGYVGLVFYYVLLFLIARYAVRIQREMRNTPFRTLAILLTIRSIADIIYFTVVFGAFENDFAETIFRLAMLKMLYNSFQKAQLAQQGGGVGSALQGVSPEALPVPTTVR